MGCLWTLRDKVSRVAFYVASATSGEKARLEARRTALMAAEHGIDFNPAQRPEDLAVLRELLQAKKK